MTTIDFGRFDVLTFDCYGTLIDWEARILAGLRGCLAPLGIDAGGDDLLERYARAEASVEAGGYLRYREVLGPVGGGGSWAGSWGCSPTPRRWRRSGGRVAGVPGLAEALARLHERFGSPSSPTATTTCLRHRTPAWA